MIVGATSDNIMMVEGEMKEVSEADMLEAIKVAHDAIKIQCKIQEELAAEVGKTKREYCHEVNDETLRERVKAELYQKCYEQACKRLNDKHQRMNDFKVICDGFIETYKAENADNIEINLDQHVKLIKRYYHDVEKEAMRRMVLDEGIRLDGRRTDEIRHIWGEVDYLPGSHGSAIFTRGETQSLTSVTLGTKLDEKIIDGVTITGKEKFLLHYNFPSFSTGEAKVPRGLSRREIGHGNLGTQGFKTHFPYRLSLHYPHRFRYTRIERFVVDGNRLRRNFGTDGYRCQNQKTGFGYCNGVDL